MDFFEFYGIPASFSPDLAQIRKQYYANSKKYHPDFYTQESEEKQAEILKLSSMNNEAFKTLSDEDLRMKYLLDLNEVLTADNKNNIPPAFLMEMMEFNEKLMELEFDFSQEALIAMKNELQQIENQLRNEVGTILEKNTLDSTSKEELNSVKNYYLKKRYLLRISENLATFASR
jgi:molecular chaperone HscB